jgi:crotonobetainyl-CoA:carnitine CoA-transferase CaiB-like acyl-CoA transferase
VGLAPLADAPSFATNTARVKNRAELAKAITEVFRKQPSRAWIGKLSSLGIPCGPINTLDAVFDDPQVRHRGIARTLPHAEAERVASVANPIRMSATGPEDRMGPPVLAEHTTSVLKGILGLDDDAIAGLVSKKVVQQWDAAK